VFVSYNSTGGRRLAGRLFLKAFLDHYYPVPPLVVNAPAPGWEARARAISGSYLSLRRAFTTWEKPIHATMRFRVDVAGPGEITVRAPGWDMRLFEVEPSFFQSADRSMAVSFREGASGMTHMAISTFAGMPMERQPFGGGMMPHGALLLGSLLVLGSALVLAPARLVAQRRAGLAPLRGWERGLRWLGTAFAGLAFGFLLFAAAALGGEERFLTGQAADGLRVAFMLPLLAVPLAAGLVAGAVIALRRGYWGHWGRIHFALLAAAAVVFLWQLARWNLLGWGV
jgi:hypothetical protein